MKVQRFSPYNVRPYQCDCIGCTRKWMQDMHAWHAERAAKIKHRLLGEDNPWETVDRYDRWSKQYLDQWTALIQEHKAKWGD